MKHLNSLILATLLISTFLIGCDEEDPEIKITSISFNSATVEVVEGTTVNLDDLLAVEGEDADKAEITFTSTDEEVVTVSGNTLTAAGVGLTTVQAMETNTNQTATIEVTVIAKTVAVTGITLDKETADLKIGETLQLTATVAPADATEQGVTWSIDFPSESKTKEDDPTAIAAVSDAGLVTAVAAGEVVVTVKSKDGDFTASTTVNVTNIAVTGITIAPDPVEVNLNESVQLTATIAPENATIKTVTWSVALIQEQVDAARTAIATSTVDTYLEITAEGLLKAKERCDNCQFTATAKSTDGDVTGTVNVSINYIPVTGITLDPSSFFKIGEGENKQVAYTITPENASDPTISWNLELAGNACKVSVAAPTIDDYATIDADGKIIGVSSSTGTCGLFVSASHPDLASKVQVEFAVVKYVTALTMLNAFGAEITEGFSPQMACGHHQYQFGVTVSPANADNTGVSWSVDEQNGFTITSNGLLKYDGSQGYGNFEVSLTATAQDGSGITETIKVIVRVVDSC